MAVLGQACTLLPIPKPRNSTPLAVRQIPPFATLFTGMVFANLFYWCTNQYVIQRTLAAKSLAEGQKGVLYSGFFKVMVPFLMMLPGVIAFHLYGGPDQPGGLASI